MSPRTPPPCRDRRARSPPSDNDADANASSSSNTNTTTPSTAPATAPANIAAATSPISPPSPTLTISHVTATATTTASSTSTPTRPAPRQGHSMQGCESGGGRGVMRRSPSDPVHPTGHGRVWIRDGNGHGHGHGHGQGIGEMEELGRGGGHGEGAAVGVAGGRARSDMGTRRSVIQAQAHPPTQFPAHLPQSHWHSHPYAPSQSPTHPGRQYRRHASSQPPPLALSTLSTSHFFHPHSSRHSHLPSSSAAGPAMNSDTSALSQQLPLSPQQPVYVLSADGSSLFLLDPSKPPVEEEPPSYQSLNVQVRPRGPAQIGSEGEVAGGGEADVSSDATVRMGELGGRGLRRVVTARDDPRGVGSDVGDGLRRVHSAAPVQQPDAATIAGLPTSRAPAPGPAQAVGQGYEHDSSTHRARASTTSALRIRTHPSAVSLSSVSASASIPTLSAGYRGGPERPRNVHHTSSPPQTMRTIRTAAYPRTDAGVGAGAGAGTRVRAHSSASTRYGNGHSHGYGTAGSTGYSDSGRHSNRRATVHRTTYGSATTDYPYPAAAHAAAHDDERAPLLGSAAARGPNPDSRGRGRGERAGAGAGVRETRGVRGLMREIWCGALDTDEVDILLLARAALAQDEEAMQAGPGMDEEVETGEAGAAADHGNAAGVQGESQGHAPENSTATTIDAERPRPASSPVDEEAEAKCKVLVDAARVNSWRSGWKRFWRPVGRKEYWRALVHLVLLNFPFALLVWPPLLVGTLAGTALLITLPIGAAVWWLTLIIARSAARLEIRMQTHHHSPPPSYLPPPTYHPIFHRIKDITPVHVESGQGTGTVTGIGYRSAPVSPSSPVPPVYGTLPSSASVQVGSDGYFQHRRGNSALRLQDQALGVELHDGHGNGQEYVPGGGEGVYAAAGQEVGEVQWEKRFVKCSYAMFCDHYSYSALSYFLLVKPLITLFSTILILALLPVAFATVAGLPVYLRAMRRWGRWQAGVSMENL